MPTASDFIVIRIQLSFGNANTNAMCRSLLANANGDGPQLLSDLMDFKNWIRKLSTLRKSFTIKYLI